jgi:hypothetical protein
MSQGSLEQLIHFSSFGISILYGTWNFTTVLTEAHHWILYWSDYSHVITSHHIPLSFVLILSTHQRINVPNGFFRWGLYSKILLAHLIPSTHATCRTLIILIYLITISYKLTISVFSCLGYILVFSTGLSSPTSSYYVHPQLCQLNCSVWMLLGLVTISYYCVILRCWYSFPPPAW